MRFRKLRISLVSGVGRARRAGGVLWVRSYWRWDSLVWGVTTKQGVLACSQSGRTMLEYLDVRATPTEFNAKLFKWKRQNFPPGGATRCHHRLPGFL